MNTYDFMRMHINHRLAQAHTDRGERHPRLKLRVIGTDMVFLIAETYSEENGLYYGLCDLGAGVPEIKTFSLREIHDMADSNGLAIAINPIYDGHDLDYYLNRSQHVCARVTQTLN